MNTQLAPHFIRKIDGVNLLWFKQSNQYIVFNDKTLDLFDCFLKSTDSNHFHDLLDQKQTPNTSSSAELYNEFEQIAKNSTQSVIFEEPISVTFESRNWLFSFYDFGNTIIKIYYASENERMLIHPQFAHLECPKKQESDINFYIDKRNNLLSLFINKMHLGSYKETDYHLLQGKFAMELLCVLTHTQECDWLGTFHASTIANDHEAIMIVGESGSGKSTLTALLMANGYYLMADDFTPILAKSQKIYPYSSAISIKEGAFELVESLFKKSDYRSHASLNSKKGMIRYIVPKDSPPNSLSCSKIVLVNYQSDANTEFRRISAEDVLPILIPDSWLSTLPDNANYFLNWLEQLQFYKLTYSNNNDVVSKFHDLFNS